MIEGGESTALAKRNCCTADRHATRTHRATTHPQRYTCAQVWAMFGEEKRGGRIRQQTIGVDLDGDRGTRVTVLAG